MIAPALNPPHSEDVDEVTQNSFQPIMVALPTLYSKGSPGTSENSQGHNGIFWILKENKATFALLEMNKLLP